MKAGKEFMIRAVKVLTFATNGLGQDRALLKAAASNMEDYLGNLTGLRDERIVESVKFGLYAEASDFSTKTHLGLHDQGSEARSLGAHICDERLGPRSDSAEGSCLKHGRVFGKFDRIKK